MRRLKLDKSRKSVAIAAIAAIVAVTLGTIFLLGKNLQTAATTDYKFVVNDTGPCGGLPVISSIVDEEGFVNVVKPFDDYNAFREFVIKPGSTAFLTMKYDLSRVDKDNTQSLLDGIYRGSLLTDSIGIYTINPDPSSIDTGNSITRLPEGQAEGISVYPAQSTNETASIVKVVYAIKADASAINGKSYIFTVFHVCHPGEMLTVGEKPHEGPLPAWNRATWY
jgi:hypothetical protein